MKSILDSFLIAISMYSAVPVPIVEWNEKNIKRAIAFFPFVGVLCALAVCAVYAVCRFFECNGVLFGALCTFAVIAVTGGIHMDGFCDTADAVFSRRSTEEKLRILKDPNCGPFAVICAVMAILLQFCAYTRFYDDIRGLWVMCAVFVMSRAMSGFSITAFALAPSSSLAKTFGEGVPRGIKLTLAVVYILSAAVCIWLGKWLGVIAAAVALLVFLWYRRMSEKTFGGTTGDVAGYFLVICESAAAVVVAVVMGRI